MEANQSPCQLYLSTIKNIEERYLDCARRAAMSSRNRLRKSVLGQETPLHRLKDDRLSLPGKMKNGNGGELSRRPDLRRLKCASRGAGAHLISFHDLLSLSEKGSTPWRTLHP